MYRVTAATGGLPSICGRFRALARFAALVASVALLIVLFSPWDFDPIWVPPVVLVAYIMGVMASRLSAVIRRAMTTRRDRDARLRRSRCRATFHYVRKK
jgi:hypothetical protein